MFENAPRDIATETLQPGWPAPAKVPVESAHPKGGVHGLAWFDDLNLQIQLQGRAFKRTANVCPTTVSNNCETHCYCRLAKVCSRRLSFSNRPIGTISPAVVTIRYNI